MAGYTTGPTNSFKRDLFSGLHCINGSQTFTASGVNGQFTLTSVSALTGLAVGMAVSGTGIAAGAVIATVDSATQVTLSKAHTGTVSGTLTATGDVIKAVLGKVSPTGTYDKNTTQYSDLTGNSDEVTGTGYTAGGNTLTATSPALSTDTAVCDFADTSWTSATFSARSVFLVNTTRRGPISNPVLSIHDFGGTQQVTAGTFTLVFPSPDASNAILRMA